MLIDRRKGVPRVQFNPPLAVRMMAIDGTWCRDCLLIDASDTGAQFEVAQVALAVKEFFLLLSFVGRPAFRRCKMVWVNGARMGVFFNKHFSQNAPTKRKLSSQRAAPQRQQAGLASASL
jgi:hypothetical protein